MKVKVFTKGRNNQYNATGVYDGAGVTVKKDSHISPTTGSKVNPLVTELRNDKSVVSKDYILLKDVKFTSASIAATFVTGNMSNGLQVWKVAPEKTLKHYIEENSN